MLDLSLYTGSILWLGVIIAMVMVQWLVASLTKASKPGAIPGMPPAQERAHKSFVFRAWRTHQNSIENLGTILGGAVFAIFAGANPVWTQVCLAIIAIARLAHMVLYYAIATNKNPSPRTWFFMLAWLANAVLIGLGFAALIG
ncbi:hypothetical protein CWE15_10985 [Aliidiomarina taiwanensis]|uniref:MAPEG family protein n=1 Tax=Aliidiomarina taiwanensis TaxID=946228 RepID=A0A432WVT3_9GAMM|nr:MAPEG family protein [Aliidiomarina taiwanensis]RUO37878.1 hypothetical protein CWE15_10985 [Aliidiomarina taiwanensis]